MLSEKQYFHFRRLSKAYHLSPECDYALFKLTEKPIGEATKEEVEVGMSFFNNSIVVPEEDIDAWNFIDNNQGVTI